MVHVGIAGWSIRKEQSHLFPGEGTHLQRYASHFDAVEINSSFFQPHRRDTYERWATSVPIRNARRMVTSRPHQRAWRTSVWCIFDNTARGAATLNAIELLRRLIPKARP